VGQTKLENGKTKKRSIGKKQDGSLSKQCTNYDKVKKKEDSQRAGKRERGEERGQWRRLEDPTWMQQKQTQK